MPGRGRQWPAWLGTSDDQNTPQQVTVPSPPPVSAPVLNDIDSAELVLGVVAPPVVVVNTGGGVGANACSIDSSGDKPTPPAACASPPRLPAVQSGAGFSAFPPKRLPRGGEGDKSAPPARTITVVATNTVNGMVAPDSATVVLTVRAL